MQIFRKTICLIIGLALSAGVAAASNAYVGVDACLSCHADSHVGAKWKRSRHAQAFESLRTQHAADVAEMLKLDKPAYAATACLQCHATAVGAEPSQLATTFDMTRGVQCESCHGAGERHAADMKSSRRNHPTRRSLRDLQSGDAMSAVCRQCHSEKGPICKVPGFSAEKEWLKIRH